MKTTTREGFLMNTSRRIPRHLVKALAASAVLVATALPMAFATVAGAAVLGVAPAASYLVLTPVSGVPVAADVNSADVTGYAAFGQGWSGAGTIVFSAAAASSLTGAPGLVTVTTTAPGVTFSGATEVAPTSVDAGQYSGALSVTAHIASTGTATPGDYNITVTDAAGSATLTNALQVNPAPTASSTAPASFPQGQTSTGVIIYGTGMTSTGTTVTFNQPAGSVVPTWSTTAVNSAGTQLTGTLTGTSDTPGAYTANITNNDGGTSTTASALITIQGFGPTTVSPSTLALPASTAGTVATPFTINGSGFEFGAVLVATGAGGTGLTFDGTTASSTLNHYYVTNVTSNSITAIVNLSSASASGIVNLQVTNPSTGGGNGATATVPNLFAIGVGNYSAIAPIITGATASVTPIPVGTGVGAVAAATLTVTGTGFDPVNGNVVSVYPGTTTTPDSHITATCSPTSGTSITCSIIVNSGATAGADSITVASKNPSSPPKSLPFASALTVAGPAIVSQSSPIAVGAPIGTSITLTGTGLTNLTTGSVTDGTGGTLKGNFAVTSATSATFVVTTSPSTADASPLTAPTLVISQEQTNGMTVLSDYTIAVVAAPTINTGSATAFVHASGPDVGLDKFGAGATAVPVTITGTGFTTGVTVGKFTNANGTADTGVSVTVTSINTFGTQISATLTIAAGDVNISDGYTVSNTNGGYVTVQPFQAAAIVIDNGPTITGVTPATATANSTNAFTVAGTGFQTGASVAASPANGTCGPTTVVLPTSLTVSCTFGPAGTAAVALVVTNPDGGSATSATVLAAAVPVVPPVAKGPHATGVHGFARTGKTVTLTISGSGFYGQPKITSTGSGVRVAVTHDTGKLLTIRVSTKLGKGERTFTIRLANGKTCKVNYATK
jgi:hypothetical protein